MSIGGTLPKIIRVIHSNMRLTEAFDIFEENMDEIIVAMRDNIRDSITNINIRSEAFGTSWVADEVKRLMIEQQVGSLIRSHNFARSYMDAKRNPTQGRITQADILRAKEYPLNELYVGKLVKHNKTYSGLCPFHNERTSSFHIKNNRFKCFGCEARGDSIDFYRRLHNVLFTQAVKALI